MSDETFEALYSAVVEAVEDSGYNYATAKELVDNLLKAHMAKEAQR